MLLALIIGVNGQIKEGISGLASLNRLRRSLVLRYACYAREEVSNPEKTNISVTKENKMISDRMIGAEMLLIY